MHAQITDRSGVTPQCTYTADNGFTRSFALNANSTSKLNIVLASPELRNWNVSVACDNGTRTVLLSVLDRVTHPLSVNTAGHSTTRAKT